MRDLCQPSIDLLRERCIEWFARQGITGPVHFPDRDELLFGEETDEVVNVVFFGSFLKRFLESSNWTARRYRFWVPCAATREVLTNLFGVPARQIGVIPRYELFPSHPAPRAFPRADEPFTLVFAGRLSPTKNIELLLKTVSALQKEQKIPVRLALCGTFDEELHIDRDPLPIGERENYRARILQLLEELPWTDRPKLFQKLGPDEWPRKKFVNPVFVSLSTFISEDFGVSAAQAQALGWPCLLSDWGGHRDVTGEEVRKLAPSLIGIYESGALNSLKARQLALAIRALLNTRGPQKSVGGKAQSSAARVQRARATLPAPVKIAELDAIRRGLVERLGRGAHLICRGEIHRLNDVRSGAVFFSKYRQLFAAPPPPGARVVLVNNLNRDGHPLSRHLQWACRLIADEAGARQIPLTFVSVQDVFHMDTLALLLQAESVLLPFFIPEMLPLGLFLQRTLPAITRFVIMAPRVKTPLGRKARAALAELKPTARAQDRFAEFAGRTELRRKLAFDVAYGPVTLLSAKSPDARRARAT